jgi:hypothetical protein
MPFDITTVLHPCHRKVWYYFSNHVEKNRAGSCSERA